MHVIVGLGNPGEEYEGTRHNAGRLTVMRVHAAYNFSLWKESKKPKFQEARGTIADKKAILVLPDTFMNNSGHAVAHFVRGGKGAGNLVIVHDDLDLPLGALKVSYARSAGGHRGVESVIRALKTNDFVRVRIGVSPAGAKGIARKPVGEGRVLKFLLGKFTPTEFTVLKRVLKRAIEAVELIITKGHVAAMNAFNS